MKTIKKELKSDKSDSIKRPKGRPFLDVKRNVLHTLKITPQEAEKLQQMSEKQGISKSEFIRQTIFKS
jgi:hypothetical protein